MHSLLRRQLRKCFGPDDTVAGPLSSFLEAVDQAYREFDADRGMLERCLELSSQELMQANSRMRAVLQAFPDLFLLLEENGTVVRILSAEASDRYLPGGPRAGSRIQDISDEAVARSMSHALEATVSRRSLATAEYSLVLAGREQYFEARFLPLVENKVLAVVRNISDRRDAEVERMKNSKLESLGLLAGGIAHDFNNLLAGLLSNLSVLRRFHPQGVEECEILEDAERACARARDLTHQLLAFSKGGAPIRAPSSIEQLVKEVAVFALRGSKVRCEFRFAPDLVPVDIDVGQMGQVIHNLVINAEQAMPNGGIVTICVNVVSGTDPRRFPVPDRRYVEILLSDHGCGIDPENLPRVFDPYFSTKQRGSGLGLATSYAIVRKHDGLIAIDSKLGVGTTVSVCLPAASLCPRPSVRYPGSLIVGHGRILVMDDEALVRRSAGRALCRMGFQADFARDGAEAILRCREAMAAEDPYRVAILDLTIPGGLGGEEAARTIRSICPGLKLIASSGYFNDAVITQYRELGFSDILPKPYSVEELSAVLRRIGL